MIELLINDAEVRQTCSMIKSMLKNDTDDALLLAYGYMDQKTLRELDLPGWLKHNKSRRIMLLFGLHGDRSLNYESDNPQRVKSTFEQLLENWELPADARNRILLYAVQHFHAKFAVVGKFIGDEDLAEAFTMDQARSLLFTPSEVVFGSSNLTHAALSGPNIEFDAHIIRGSEAIGDFSSKMHSVVSRAIEVANAENTFSNDFTITLRDILDRRLKNLEAQAKERDCKEMEAYSNELIRDLMDPDK